MSHGYVRSTWGCNCFQDSSFKRYNRAHLGGDFTINIFSGANTCVGNCGCGQVNGFWGGFGLALGNFAGNLLMGGMNMLGGWAGGLGGMFGGFSGGMFGGLGGILGGFGGGWGNSGWANSGFGNNGVKDDDYYASKYGSPKKTSKPDADNDGKKTDKAGKTGEAAGDGKKISDKDYATLNKLDEAEKVLETKNDLKPEDIEDLLKNLNNAKDTDGVNTDDNTKQKQTIVDRLKKLAEKHGFEIDNDGNVTASNKPVSSNASTGATDGTGTPINNTPYTNTDLAKIVEDLNNLPEVKALGGVTITNDNGKIKVSGILFPTGNADLTEEQKTALRAIANQLHATNCSINVTGTSSKRPYKTNNEENNKQLAIKRANGGKSELEHNTGRKFTVKTDKVNMAGTPQEADKFQNIVLEIEM